MPDDATSGRGDFPTRAAAAWSQAVRLRCSVVAERLDQMIKEYQPGHPLTSQWESRLRGYEQFLEQRERDLAVGEVAGGVEPFTDVMHRVAALASYVEKAITDVDERTETLRRISLIGGSALSRLRAGEYRELLEELAEIRRSLPRLTAEDERPRSTRRYEEGLVRGVQRWRQAPPFDALPRPKL